MESKSYADLMQMARQRHATIASELKALEAAFPEIGLTTRRAKPRRSDKRTAEGRAKHSLAMKAAWARRRAAKPNGADYSQPASPAMETAAPIA